MLDTTASVMFIALIDVCNVCLLCRAHSKQIGTFPHYAEVASNRSSA